MMQLTEEHKSLWRIQKNYLKDAGKSKEVKDFWTKMAKDKENHIKELGILIKKNM
ncbi:MAG: hypothetical protein AAB438_01180 [Patescibacteria group bacterium]